MSKLPTPAPQPSMGEIFKANVIFLIVGCFILYLFTSLLEFLFKPLKILSRQEASDRIDGQVEEKRHNRYLRDKESHPDDPMEQFRLRFVDEMETYKDDTDNEIYYVWFQEWRKGNVIDSRLRWAPNVLDDNDEMRDNFIQYMKIQLALHKKASLLKKMLFTTTIHKYFPELSPNLRNLEEDLAQYNEEIREKDSEDELQNEIKIFGLPEGAAEYLSKKNINAKTLKEEAIFLKRCIEGGFDSEVSICALENNITEETGWKVIDGVINNLYLPGKVAVALIKEEITGDQLTDLATTMVDFCVDWGHEIYTEDPSRPGQTHYDSILNIRMSGYRGKRVVNYMNGK